MTAVWTAPPRQCSGGSYQHCVEATSLDMTQALKKYSKIHLENSDDHESSQRSLQYCRPRPARDDPPGVVRSGRDPATAFFGRLMSSLHSGMAA